MQAKSAKKTGQTKKISSEKMLNVGRGGAQQIFNNINKGSKSSSNAPEVSQNKPLDTGHLLFFSIFSLSQMSSVGRLEKKAGCAYQYGGNTQRRYLGGEGLEFYFLLF